VPLRRDVVGLTFASLSFGSHSMTHEGLGDGFVLKLDQAGSGVLICCDARAGILPEAHL
jgi:hypothetical protein